VIFCSAIALKFGTYEQFSSWGLIAGLQGVRAGSGGCRGQVGSKSFGAITSLS
jgi:hypothetical protein